ncbi:myeloid differentiation primary response protein MyD88-like [Anopheles darlingi]|uniref:myeloid differentiation primary response protein MyD88-like n=1 Tax=Anopheles darlingi TaxID=43151 RepID=UPI00210064DE|nr:myeloid differentiation primary response protein MyD88-like [Anopheles darlingi]
MSSSLEQLENFDDSQIDLANVPLQALSHRSRELLYTLLNQQHIFTSEEGYFRDWRGAFEVIGVPRRFFVLVENSPSPAKCLLELWVQEDCERPANLAQLQEVLGCIDRWDVVDDTSEMFRNDALKLLRNQQMNPVDLVDMNIMTRDDTHDHQQQYDAFVLYADQNVAFATKMVATLENRGMRLCLKDRDILVGGDCEYEVVIRLITERCRRLVVIISQAFVANEMNKFAVAFAHALQIEKRKRKVIPCVIEECEVPQHLQFSSKLNYLRRNIFYNFWDKLTESIRDPVDVQRA